MNNIEEITLPGGNSTQYRKNQGEEIDNKYVQSFISNISAPKSLNELFFYINENKRFNIEDVLIFDSLEWTVPRWAKIGDVVFYMHAKCANNSLRNISKELNESKANYSEYQYDEITKWIDYGFKLHRKYGGKIFAIGKVTSVPEIDPENNEYYTDLHYSSQIYAKIEDVYVLEQPIDISEFRDFISISRVGGITPVFGDDFLRLKDIILSQNILPKYYQKCVSAELPLAKINDENWLSISREYRNSFMLEMQFRTFYVNHLLKKISDLKKIYRECRCRKSGMADSFVDNVIKFHGKFLPVEVKLSVLIEKDINTQLKKYCYDDAIYLEQSMKNMVCGNNVYRNRVLVIDTNNIYMYKYEDDELVNIIGLDDLTYSFERLKETIMANL